MKPATLKTYGGNTAWIGTEKVYRSLLGIVVNVMMARYLGPHDFGILAYALGLVTMVSSFVGLGLDTYLVKELVYHKDKHSKILGTAFILRFFGAFFSAILLVVIVWFSGDDQIAGEVVLLCGLSLFFQSFGVIDLFFQSRVRSKWVTLASLVQITMSAGLKLFLIWKQYSLISFAWVIGLEGLILSVGLVVAYKRFGMNFSDWMWRASTAKHILKVSWPIALSTLLTSFYTRIDYSIIKHLLNPEKLGIYSVSVTMIEIWNLIPILLCTSFFPLLIETRERDVLLYRKGLQWLTDFLSLAGLLLTLAVFFLADFIIPFLFSDRYLLAIPSLKILSYGFFFTFTGVLASYWMVLESLTHRFLYRIGFGIVVKVTANFLLIPHFSIDGAAWSTLISVFSASVVYEIFDPKCRMFFVMKVKALMPFSRLLSFLRLTLDNHRTIDRT